VSSAILYLAIIAIWAGFLVPAWLRRPHAQSERTTVEQMTEQEAREAEANETGAYEQAEDELTVQYVEELTETEDDVHVETDIHVEVSHHERKPVYFEEEPAVYSETSEYTEDYGPEYAEYPESEVPADAQAGSGPPAPRPSQSREQMLRARRRMLSVLVAMTAVTGLFSFMSLVAWWIVAPPAVLLALYVLLLREIAMADAELARKRSLWEAAEAKAWARHLQAEAEREAYEASMANSGAQIIDISGRVSDQLYDQYADAAVRAVGD
jgi:hypothetical protein